MVIAIYGVTMSTIIIFTTCKAVFFWIKKFLYVITHNGVLYIAQMFVPVNTSSSQTFSTTMPLDFVKHSCSLYRAPSLGSITRYAQELQNTHTHMNDKSLDISTLAFFSWPHTSPRIASFFSPFSNGDRLGISDVPYTTIINLFNFW